MREPMDRFMWIASPIVLVAAFIAIVVGVVNSKPAQANEDVIGMSKVWPEPYRSRARKLEDLVRETKSGGLMIAWVSADSVRRVSADGGAIKKTADAYPEPRPQYIRVVRSSINHLWTIDFTEYSVNLGWEIEPFKVDEQSEYYLADSFAYPKDGVGQWARDIRAGKK